MERSSLEGIIKWGSVAGCVIALECIGENSLTHYAHRAMEHRIGRWVVPAAIGITAMHLMDKEHHILPESIDAFNIIAHAVDRLQEWRS
jgi:hypothetical protein